MPKFKKQESYKIFVGGEYVEISEELYRVWLLHTNRERVSQRRFCRQVLKTDNEIKLLPAKWMYLEDYIERPLIAERDTEPDVSMWRKVVLSTLNEAIGSIPGKLRSIIILSFYQEKTQAEIAEILNMSQPAVYYNKQRALTLLREYMIAHGCTGEDVARYFIDLD